jgi:hypothetical protein
MRGALEELLLLTRSDLLRLQASANITILLVMV